MRIGEDLLDGFLTNAVHHCVKHLRALVLVFNKRITLTHCTKTDTLLEVIHLVEVLAPQTINRCNHHATLKRTHGFIAQLLNCQRILIELIFGFFVLRVNIAQNLAHKVLARQRANAAVLLCNLFGGDRWRVVSAQGIPQFLQVPFTRR